MTKYLTKSGKCQKESYYECIASHLDVIEINECHKKCIPNVFSNLGKAYNTPFCLNDTASQKCTGSPHFTRFHFTRFTLYTRFIIVSNKFTLCSALHDFLTLHY